MRKRRRRWRTTTRIDDNKDYCCEEEKEDNKDKDMNVCVVPIGQHIIHPTQHVQYLASDHIFWCRSTEGNWAAETERIFRRDHPYLQKGIPGGHSINSNKNHITAKRCSVYSEAGRAAAAEAKAAVAVTAAARSDNTDRPPGNDRYGLQFQSNSDDNQQNYYDINRERRPVPDERFKNCGVFKYNGERLPWLRSQINPTGKEHPPLVSVHGRPPGKICMNGSTCRVVCCRLNCSNIHLVGAGDISDGMVTLNRYVRDFKELNWINPAASRTAAKARPGPLDHGR